MNVLLIEPPYFRLLGEKRSWVPVGLLSIAAVLRKAGHDVSVYNADADYSGHEHVLNYSDRFYLTRSLMDDSDLSSQVFQEIVETIKGHEADVVGISVKSDSVPVVKKLIGIVNEIVPAAKIILGGSHFDVDPEPRYFSESDVIIRGEAEGIIVQAIESLGTGRRTGLTPLSAQGTIGLSSLETISLNYLPRFQFERLSVQKKQLLSTSRGCPYRCSFCYMSIKSAPPRFVAGDRVVEDMVALQNNHGISKFYIVDDTFGMQRRQLDEMYESLRRRQASFAWSCMSHVKVLDRATISLMKKMGCNAIHLGIESGSENMLSRLRKNVRVSEITKCAQMIHDHGIELRAFMMVGLPDETDSDIDQSVKLLTEIRPEEIAAQVYQPYPNTILWQEIEQRGANKQPDWLSFRRCRLNYDLFPGQEKAAIDRRIELFLNFADAWNQERNASTS